jgi:dipeptidyl aminopeptidase/acylaminoacyl peptidase
MKPFGWNSNVKYPAIFDIHGGPRSKFGYATMFEHQIYSSEGYAVVFGNIRGSDGYDQEFADIRFKYGTRDYHDFLEMVEYVLKQNNWIDPKRLGVTGLSYGGFMTNWIIGHTSIFRCAVSQNSISSWDSFFGTSDIGFHFSKDQIGGDPWTNHGVYMEKSPITYAQRVTTPTLFIHSFNDYRCWIDQSILMHNALRYLGKKTKMIIYGEGSHSFRNLAKPSIRKQRLGDMMYWFNEYLRQS